MLGIIFAVLYGAIWLFDYLISPFFKKITLFISLLVLTLIPLITWSQTDLWSKPLKQTVFWAQQHPRSKAAQAQGVVVFQSIGRYNIAEKYARNMVKVFPKLAAPYLYLIDLACLSKQVKMPDMQQVIHRFQTSKYDHVTPTMLMYIVEKRKKGFCQIDFETMDKMFKTLIHNPNNALFQAYFYYRYALFQVSEKRYGLAVESAKQALILKDSIHLRFKMITWLIADKQFDEAMAFLQKTLVQLNSLKTHLYKKELTLFEAKIPVLQELHEMGFEIQEN
jgi:tetratricopeptide (TPR) repeat protein